MTWTPLSRRGADPGEAEGPYEGVPGWLRSSLVAWLRPKLMPTQNNRYQFQSALVREMDRLIRAPQLGRAADNILSEQAWTGVVNAVTADEDLFLDVIDFLVSRKKLDKYALGALETILSDGGSVWTVATPDGAEPRLERRIDPTVRDAAMGVMTVGDRASEHLAAAWTALYGREPSAGEGYREAVRAVEAAAKPVVTPADAVATLGKMIRAMEDAPAKWSVTLKANGEPVADVARMMALLWTAEHDRHGTDDENAPLNVSLEEARAALHLAVLLVQWFREGDITRR